MFMKLFNIYLIFIAFKLELIEGVCSPGYNLIQGTCLPQDIRCPNSSLYFNGACNHITQTSCPTGQISINSCCCYINCLLNCAQMQSCSCCGLHQWTGQSFGACMPQVSPYLPYSYPTQAYQYTTGNTCDYKTNYQPTNLQPCVPNAQPCQPSYPACGDNIPICNATIQTPVCRPVCNNTVDNRPPFTTEMPSVPSTLQPCTTDATKPVPTVTPTYPDRTTKPPIAFATTPKPAITCNPGSILIGGICRLLYCPPGTVLQNNFCTLIRCPYGMIWTGRQCTTLSPIQHNITYNNTIVNHINPSRADIVLNYVNNITVNTTFEGNEGALELSNNETSTEEVTSTVKPNTTLGCCTVKSPRICELRGQRWSCFNRHQYLCGEFCISPIIYLRVPQIEYQYPSMIMPPLMPDCHLNGLCPPVEDYYDCSGCQFGHMEYCSAYCYNYHCPRSHCNFYDQQLYCSQYSISFGCEAMDGCYNSDWCLDHN